MLVPDILTNPYNRPRSHYDYKVIGISGNTIAVDVLDGNQRTVQFDKIDPVTFENKYKDQLNDLYIGINMDGKVFLFTKEPVTTKWDNKE